MRLRYCKYQTNSLTTDEGFNPFSCTCIPRVYQKVGKRQQRKKEREWLTNIDVFKKLHESEWAAPTFIQPKKQMTSELVLTSGNQICVSSGNHSRFPEYPIYSRNWVALKYPTASHWSQYGILPYSAGWRDPKARLCWNLHAWYIAYFEIKMPKAQK